MATSGSQAETYAITEETTSVLVTPRTATQIEQIVRFFIEDLTHFLHLTNIDLMRELEIPLDPDAPENREEILRLLYEDLTHMLREGLISGIHLLLSEPEPDTNTGRYLLRYHAHYTIEQDFASQRTLQTDLQRFGGLLAPPPQVWEKARFALVIDWNRSASQRRRDVRRPRYFFDWVPPRTQFDESSLVRYREGGLTCNGATAVNRDEFRAPGYPVHPSGSNA